MVARRAADPKPLGRLSEVTGSNCASSAELLARVHAQTRPCCHTHCYPSEIKQVTDFRKTGTGKEGTQQSDEQEQQNLMAKHPLLPYLRAGTNASLIVSKHHFRPTLCSQTLEKRASSLSLQQEAAVQASLVPTSSSVGGDSPPRPLQQSQQVKYGWQQHPGCPLRGSEEQSPCPALPAKKLLSCGFPPEDRCGAACKRSPSTLPLKGSQRGSPILPGSEVAVGEAEPLPAGWMERAGSGKPSLVLRRRLGCVSPFRGIKQVSPFRLHGLSPPRQLSSAFLAFSGPAAVVGQRGAAPCSRPPNFFLPRPGITRAAQGEALPAARGSGHPAASPCLWESCSQQWYLGSIRGWRCN